MNNSSDFEKHSNDLNDRLPFLSVDELAQALQLVVERITFSDIANHADDVDKESVLYQIENIMGQDIPLPMIDFVKKLAKDKELMLLHGDNGRLFLQYFISQLKSIYQVEIVTAVKLRYDAKKSYSEILKKHYKQPIRVVFTTSPSIIAGFVLRDQTKSVDRSLGTYAPRLINEKLGLTAKGGV